MNDFSSKVLRAQILLLEAERMMDKASLNDPEIRETLASISEKAFSLLNGLASAPAVSQPQSEQQEADEIMDYKALAKYLKRPIGTLYSDVSNRRIPFTRIGGGAKWRVRFQKSVIDNWMISNTVKPAGGRI